MSSAAAAIDAAEPTVSRLIVHEDAGVERGTAVVPARVRHLASATLPTKYGAANIDVFDSRPGGDGEVVVLSHREAAEWGECVPLVRLHSTCLTGEVLGSLTCDCGPQLDHSLMQIMAARHGILLYITNHEGRGIGLASKVMAIKLQAQGFNTVEANLALGLPVDARQFGHSVDVLRQLGVRRLRLLTNNPEKLRAFDSSGIEVVERVPLAGFTNPHNQRYLDTKEAVLGHLLTSKVDEARGDNGARKEAAREAAV